MCFFKQVVITEKQILHNYLLHNQIKKHTHTHTHTLVDQFLQLFLSFLNTRKIYRKNLKLNEVKSSLIC